MVKNQVNSKNTEDNKDLKSKIISDDPAFIFMNIYVDSVVYLLILLVLSGSYYTYFSLDEILEYPKSVNPNFVYPKYSELLPSLAYFILMVVFNYIFKKLTSSLIEKILNPNYLNEPDKELVKIYKNKVSTNIYKCMFYLSSTILGYYVLKDLDFFPSTMLGKGNFANLFKNQYPNYFYFDKPKYFDFYYNLNLSFALFDMWNLVSNPLQSDFLFMILHHITTVSLIVFSYVSSFSNIGSIVYYIFYFGDVFSYVVRVALHINVSEKFISGSTYVFLTVFSYTRLYAYGDILYHLLDKLYYASCLEYSMVSFLFILMCLNILWIVLISKKILKYLLTGNIEEIYKFKINKKSK